jgi:hypothetical protein
MPKIELKNIKYAAFASEETNCYSATLYVDGKKWGEVSNDGHGGADMFHGVVGKGWEDIRKLDERLKVENPKVPSNFADCPDFDANLELLCGEIVDAWLVERDMKNALKKKVLFYKEAPKAKGAPLYEAPLKGRTFEQVRSAYEAKFPGAIILNALPVEQALPLYRMAA